MRLAPVILVFCLSARVQAAEPPAELMPRLITPRSRIDSTCSIASYPTYKPVERPSYWAWSVGALIGAGTTWLIRPEMISSAASFHRLRVDPSLSDEQRVDQLERLWVRVYDDEVLNRAWWQQLICVATNVLPFLVVGLGWQQWDWAYMLLGIASSELQILSFPQLLRRFGVEPRIVRAL